MTFTIVAFAVVVLFVVGQVTLYSWQGQDDSDTSYHERGTPDLLDR